MIVSINKYVKNVLLVLALKLSASIRKIVIFSSLPLLACKKCKIYKNCHLPSFLHTKKVQKCQKLSFSLLSHVLFAYKKCKNMSKIVLFSSLLLFACEKCKMQIMKKFHLPSVCTQKVQNMPKLSSSSILFPNLHIKSAKHGQ